MLDLFLKEYNFCASEKSFLKFVLVKRFIPKQYQYAQSRTIFYYFCPKLSPMNLELLIDILKEFKEFEDSSSYKPTATVEDFTNFLNEKSYDKENPKNLTEKYDLEVNDLENQIAKQVILLGRYSKHLIKKALEPHPDLVNDDFTYLFRMMDYDSLTKTQLIEKNAHEKQSGLRSLRGSFETVCSLKKMMNRTKEVYEFL